MVTRTKHIADLLMAAAHADPQRSESAYDLVCNSLKQVMGASYILTSIDERLKKYDPKKFSMEKTLKAIALKDDVEKRQLIELIASVHDPDVVAVDQDEYLRKVADAIGLSEEDYEDLIVDVQEARDSLYERRDSLIEARNSLLGRPPPLPKT